METFDLTGLLDRAAAVRVMRVHAATNALLFVTLLGAPSLGNAQVDDGSDEDGGVSAGRLRDVCTQIGRINVDRLLRLFILAILWFRPSHERISMQLSQTLQNVRRFNFRQF